MKTSFLINSINKFFFIIHIFSVLTIVTYLINSFQNNMMADIKKKKEIKEAVIERNRKASVVVR